MHPRPLLLLMFCVSANAFYLGVTSLNIRNLPAKGRFPFPNSRPRPSLGKNTVRLQASETKSFKSRIFAASIALLGNPNLGFSESDASGKPQDSTSDEDGGDQINGKKLAILGGALFVADILSGALTGRSVLKIVGNNKAGVSAWQQKVVDQLLEKEKRDAADRMGVKTIVENKPRGPSATGNYAATDPFEIAKQKYQKKESIEDLQRDLRQKLEKSKSLGFNEEDDE